MRRRQAQPKLAAIPTKYRGLAFRSRLEATWACFFDKAGIEDWKYEPLDLSGYIPDFIIRGGTQMVEVKPAVAPHDLWEAVAKIEASGWNRTALIVGADVPLSRGCPVGLYGADHAWRYARLEDLAGDRTVSLWLEAKNELQWMPRGVARGTVRSRPTADPLADAHGEAIAEHVAREEKAQEARFQAYQATLGLALEAGSHEILALIDRFKAKRPSLASPFRTARSAWDGCTLHVWFPDGWRAFARMYVEDYESAAKELFGRSVALVTNTCPDV